MRLELQRVERLSVTDESPGVGSESQGACGDVCGGSYLCWGPVNRTALGR